MSAPDDAPPPGPPTLRIVRGEPDPVELAALVAVITAAAGAGDDEPEEIPTESRWATPERLLRPAVLPTGWWASGLPR